MNAAELVWIEKIEALTVHNRVLAVHGGPPGVRGQNLLLSAIARAPDRR